MSIEHELRRLADRDRDQRSTIGCFALILIVMAVLLIDVRCDTTKRLDRIEVWQYEFHQYLDQGFIPREEGEGR